MITMKKIDELKNAMNARIALTQQERDNAFSNYRRCKRNDEGGYSFALSDLSDAMSNASLAKQERLCAFSIVLDEFSPNIDRIAKLWTAMDAELANAQQEAAQKRSIVDSSKRSDASYKKSFTEWLDAKGRLFSVRHERQWVLSIIAEKHSADVDTIAELIRAMDDRHAQAQRRINIIRYHFERCAHDDDKYYEYRSEWQAAENHLSSVDQARKWLFSVIAC